MGFNNQHASPQGVNIMSTRYQSVSNNRKYPQNHVNFARSSEKGADFKHRKKAAAVFPEPEIRCAEAERQSASAEGLSDENNCVWLSSDCRSHSLPSFDTPHDVLDNQFSVLSLSGCHGAPLDIGRVVYAFDGSKISPMEEASLLYGTNQDDSEELEEEEIARWLQYSVQNEVNDLTVRSSECGESSWERSSCNDLSMFGSSSTSLSTHDEIPSYVQDIDGSDFSSLLDLEKEDSEFLLDREHGYIVSEATEFSSPCKSNINLQCGYSISSCKTLCRTEEAKSSVKLLTLMILSTGHWIRTLTLLLSLIISYAFHLAETQTTLHFQDLVNQIQAKGDIKNSEKLIEKDAEKGSHFHRHQFRAL